MIQKEEILAFLREQKENLFSEFQLVKIGLIGSFARNEGTDRSDIDLIVEFQPNTENLFEKKSEIKSLVEKEFNREVDLCREKYLKPYFKSQILKSVIYVVKKMLSDDLLNLKNRQSLMSNLVIL